MEVGSECGRLPDGYTVDVSGDFVAVHDCLFVYLSPGNVSESGYRGLDVLGYVEVSLFK